MEMEKPRAGPSISAFWGAVGPCWRCLRGCFGHAWGIAVLGRMTVKRLSYNVSDLCGVSLSPSPAGEAEEAQGEDSVSNPGSRNSVPRASTADHPTSPSPWGPSFWAVSAGQSHPDPGSRKLPVPSSPKTRKTGSCQLKQNSPTLAAITHGAQGGPSGHPLERSKKAEQDGAISEQEWRVGWENTGLRDLHPGFRFGFMLCDLRQALSLSGCLICRRMR